MPTKRDRTISRVARASKTTRQYPDDRASLTDFQDLPNVGPSIADDFRKLGFQSPADLIGQDPYTLYDKLCILTNVRQDPCVADVFVAAVAFMEGAPPHPWWHYTAARKQVFASRSAASEQK